MEFFFCGQTPLVSDIRLGGNNHRGRYNTAGILNHSHYYFSFIYISRKKTEK